MVKLSGFDLLLKLHQSRQKSISREQLIELIRGDARYKKTSRRTIYERIRRLKKQRFIREEGNRLQADLSHGKTWDLLAFLYWSRLRDRDYNKLVNESTIRVFESVFRGAETLEKLMQETKLSKPTTLKYIQILEKNRFLRKEKKKPLILKANINDHTLYYINYLELDLGKIQNRYHLPNLPEIHSRRLMRDLIRIHTYSTTVTEGNTCTEEDVDRIMKNQPVKLTPRETLEIINTERSVEKLLEYQGKEITEERINKLHIILMNNLVEKPGEYHYGRKKIIGSTHKPPDSEVEIESTMKGLINFIHKYIRKTNPLLLAPLVHFMFVNIHPFQDGNGRIARLLHSWILLKKSLPLF
ncbi:MAG: Fic family protein, partial [Candidatus Altiarchaeales archaeon]|nr:Fic family protein [Candidatus Altiarchaeales archaeon]